MLHKKFSRLGLLAFTAVFLSYSLTASLALPNEASALTGDLVTQLKFNETSGTTAADSSGNGNFGTLVNGPTWTTGGKIGGAINFDGVNDYVTTNADVGGLDAKTFAFWIKPGSKMKNWAGLVLEADSFNSAKYTGFVGFPNMTVELYQGYDNGNGQFYSPAVSVSQKKWSHVVGTINKAAGLMKVYVNGALKGTSSWPAMMSATLYNPAGGIKIGGTPAETYAFLGQMDEVNVYNRALSDQEVSALYNSYSSTTPPAPDTTAPTVSITAPTNGSTVSGASTVLSASAADNVGVTGVQFKLDGANLGSALATSPYTTNWDTTSASNGTHTISATARDAAGNVGTSSNVSVTVNNLPPPPADTTPPTVPTGLSASAVSSAQINLAWNASTDDVAVTGYQVYRNGTKITAVSGNTYSDSGLTPSTLYSYTVAAYDAAGNVSAQSGSASATTQAATVGTTPCNGFYPAGFALVSGQDTTAPTASPKPARGVRFADPAYHTCVVRTTDHTAEGTPGFLRNDYSRRQAFNADSSKFIAYAYNGDWMLYDAKTLSRIKILPNLGGDAEPQWNSTQPDILYYIPTNGVGMKLYELNVATDAVRVVGDFGAQMKARWNTANAVWTKSEGSPSADGRYWAFMVDDANWASLGLFTWDLQTDTIIAMYDTNGDRPDHVSMSPSGNYAISSWDSAKGTVAFSRDFSTQLQVNARSEHSDIALDANGDDVYVSVDYQSNGGDVFMVNLRTGVRTTLFPTYISGTATAVHFSGKAFNKPGWALISTYADYGSALQWLHRKIFAVELTANPRILNIAYHHVDPYSGNYWDEPHATVNRDFTKIMFNSNWNAGNTDVDDYMIELPADAVPAISLATAAAPTPQIAGEKILAPTSVFVFTRNLKIGSRGEDVRQLQMFLNIHGFTISTSGAGSPGKETTYYGVATSRAVAKFQETHKDELLKPLKLLKGSGIFNSLTRNKVQAILNLGQ